MIGLFFLACQTNSLDTGWENCENAPVVNYENFGEGFLLHSCQGCHASTTENRYGAPENVVFDTKEHSIEWKERIRATTIGESPTMPPAGVLSEEEEIMLYWWLVCNDQE